MNLIPESIIKEAIRNGEYADGSTYAAQCCESDLILDPHFWQALGKARGWKWPPPEVCNHHDCRSGIPCRHYTNSYKKPFLRFCDLLLSSPTQDQINTFWENLPPSRS